MILALAFALFITVVAVVATGPIEAPAWVKSRVESKIESFLGTESLEIDSLEILFDVEFMAPAAHIHGIKVWGAQGELVAALTSAIAEFEMRELLTGQLMPRSLRVPKLRMDLVQEVDGSLALAVQPLGIDSGNGLEEPTTFSDVIDSLREGDLAFLDSVEVEEVELDIRNKALERSWRVERGRLKIENQGSSVAGQLTFRISRDEGPRSFAAIEFLSADSEKDTLVKGRFSGVTAGDLPLGEDFNDLARRLDAPISFEAEARLQVDGKLTEISGSVRIREGSYTLSDDRSIAVNAAEFDFAYKPLASRVEFPRFLLDSEVLKLDGNGYALSPEIPTRTVESWLEGWIFSTRISLGQSCLACRNPTCPGRWISELKAIRKRSNSSEHCRMQFRIALPPMAELNRRRKV